MKRIGKAICMAAGTLLLAVPALAETVMHEGQGRAVVTVLPKRNRETPVNITLQDVQVKLNRRESNATKWVPLRGANDRLEVVILIDGALRSSIGQQFGYIEDFINGLPANSKVAVAYMEHGQALLTSPLSTDHAQAIHGLRLPGGLPGSSGSPYFCLSDLAKHWPASDPIARREVLMITDGVDPYEPRFDPNNPYVQAAINDSVKAGLVVYSIYWHNRGRGDYDFDDANMGQSLLLVVTRATGGTSYWQGDSEPVSLKPYLDDLAWQLQNQYRLSFTSPLKNKSEIQNMALKIGGPAAKVTAPEQVYVTHAASE
jgi:hypothetical protein